MNLIKYMKDMRFLDFEVYKYNCLVEIRFHQFDLKKYIYSNRDGLFKFRDTFIDYYVCSKISHIFVFVKIMLKITYACD